jgi:aminodeoxyfutalosine synthase
MTVTDAELQTFAASHDIITLGVAADELRRSMHGARTTFVRVADIDAAPGAPVEVPAGAGELRIVGVPADRAAAVRRVAEVLAASPSVPVSAFSLADLEELAARGRVPLRALLEELKSVGLEIIAAAPFDRLRDPRLAIEETNIAGLRLARLTIQALAQSDPSALYRAVAALQHDIGVIRAFAPLPRSVNPAVPTTGYDDVRRVALARLFVENVPSIQVDWALYGPKLAQVALTVGADDLDSVSALDDAGQGRRRAPLEEVRRNIRAASLDPCERDGRFDART